VRRLDRRRALSDPAGGRARVGKRPHVRIRAPDLTDEETAALTRLLRDTIDNDRYPLSPRIQTLRGILAKFRP
jgi:hypothetical protein